MNSADDAFNSVMTDLIQRGNTVQSRYGETLELTGYSFKLQHPECNILMNKSRKFSLRYASAELLWYLSACPDVDMITPFAPSYAKFAEEDGSVYGAYGPRIMSHIQDVEAKIMTESRQAILAFWRRSDVEVHVKDVPCTIALQFLSRNGKLDCVAFMRSNDAWLGLPNDVFCFTMLQQMLAHRCALEMGTYSHHVGSMHVYKKNVRNYEYGFDRSDSLVIKQTRTLPDWKTVVMLVNAAFDGSHYEVIPHAFLQELTLCSQS